MNNNKTRVFKNFDIRKNYEYISMLGNGNLGKVRLYRDRKNKDLLFAIKTIKKIGLSSYEFSLLKNELSILSNLDHPNIVKYYGEYEDDYYIHILMEYLKGYDLYKIIALKKYIGFDERNICEIIYQILQALSFIHNQNIVHRDIKPENILFANKNDYSTLKLIDFAFATKKQKDNHVVGTPYYIAPEMIDGISYPQSDIWSLGVILYLMLTGKYPFFTESNKDLFLKIKNDEPDSQPLNSSKMSEEAKDFIQKCLIKDYKKRMTTEEALKHNWIAKFYINKNSNLLNNDIVLTLLNFANKNAFQKEIYYFIAKISSEKDILQLKQYFNKLDVDNSGILTIDEIEKGFKEINIDITKEELQHIWEGLDFHKDDGINYSEFLAAMISSFNFHKEEKLWSVFCLFKKGNKNKDYITYESICNSAKSLNLNIKEEEIKKCFEEYDKEINFETFKKLILDSELGDRILTEFETTNLGTIKRRSSKDLSINKDIQ